MSSFMSNDSILSSKHMGWLQSDLSSNLPAQVHPISAHHALLARHVLRNGWLEQATTAAHKDLEAAKMQEQFAKINFGMLRSPKTISPVRISLLVAECLLRDGMCLAAAWLAGAVPLVTFQQGPHLKICRMKLKRPHTECLNQVGFKLLRIRWGPRLSLFKVVLATE